MKKKTNTRTRMLIAATVSIVIYTIISLILQFVTQTEVSSTLTYCWFGFWTVELWNLSRITIKKQDNKYYNAAGMPESED